MSALSNLPILPNLPTSFDIFKQNNTSKLNEIYKSFQTLYKLYDDLNKEYNIFLSDVVDPYMSSICNKTPFPVMYHIIKYAKEELNKDFTSTSLMTYCPTSSNKINEQYMVQPFCSLPSYETIQKSRIVTEETTGIISPLKQKNKKIKKRKNKSGLTSELLNPITQNMDTLASSEKKSVNEQSLIKTSLVKTSLVQPSLVKPSLVKPSLVKTSLVQPSLVQPSLVKPSLVQPSLVQPSLVQPSLVQPSLVQPSLVKPSLVQPSLVKPSLSRYIYFVCVLYILLYGLIYICKN